MRFARTCFFALSLFACGKLADEERGHGNGGGYVPGPNDTTSSSGSSGFTVGEDHVDVNTTPPPARTDLHLQTLASVECQGWSDCGLSGPHVFVGTWGDQASCVAQKSAQHAIELAKRGVTVTQAQLDACAARRALTPCESNIVECQFTGSLTDGDTCTIDAQCQSGSCTFPDNDPTKNCGQCTPRSAAGTACSYDFDCAIGLACNDVTKKCISPLPAGAKCNADENICGPGLACLNGACAERLPIGAACVSRGRIKYGYYDDCAGGSWCKSDAGVCTAFDKVGKTAGIGEACAEDVLCRVSSCNQTTHVCEARAADPNTPPRPICN